MYILRTSLIYAIQNDSVFADHIFLITYYFLFVLRLLEYRIEWKDIYNRLINFFK